MDERHLKAGEEAYASGDWHQAALELMAAVHGCPADGAGMALHHAGNALMRLGRHADAATVYAKASRDTDYDRRGAVLANLGAALTAVGRHDDALGAYEEALDDAEYPTPHRALLGRAGALYALERFDEATGAYRQAAWADGNADPGRALNNLGLSFMALGKPEDAVEAFRAALGVEGYAGKGKASANLALAYATMGFFEEAVLEFETARDEYGHVLAGATLEAYESSLAKARTAGAEPVGPPAEDLERETVEGWVTGDISSVASGGEAPSLPDADDEATARFFAITEDEMRDEDRAVRKAERSAKRTPKAIALRVLVGLLIVAAVAGLFGGTLYLGYGYPTQEQTVTGLLDAYRSGTPYVDFWVAVPPTDVRQEMRALPAKFVSYEVRGVARKALRSMVLVVVQLDSGVKLSYDVQLAREGVGWKVFGVKNHWGSTAG